MPERRSPPLLLKRDGAGQADRRLPSLDPDVIGIDERTVRDWLAFSHAFARELRYFDADNQPSGDWAGFLNPDDLDAAELPAHWQEVERFINQPEAFDETTAHRRPHFVLFLCFLRLLCLSQQRLNRLTREHLDFYYQQFLSLQKQAAIPDRVHLLVQLAADVGQSLLPAGTLVAAGKDSLGEEMFYHTDDDLVVNGVQVKHLFSVFVDKKVTGIQQAREQAAASGSDSLSAMMAIAYGDPAPGGPLPPYPPGKRLDDTLLASLGDMAGFVRSDLHMDFYEFRKLMLLKTRRSQSASTDWRTINEVLEVIGNTAVGQTFSIQPPDSNDFPANLRRALGNRDPDFSRLSNVSSLEDLYFAQSGETRAASDAKAFIVDQFHLQLPEFVRLMEKKIEVDKDWRVVNGLLEGAGQRSRKDPDFQLPLAGNPASPNFAVNLEAALGSLRFTEFKDLFEVKADATDLDRFSDALQVLEGYFFCSLEDFAFLIDASVRERLPDDQARPSAAEWARVYAILTEAFARKVYAGRRTRLNGFRTTAQSPASAVEAMLRLAAGETLLAARDLPGRLDSYWPKDQAGARAYATVSAILQNQHSPDLKAEDWQSVVNAIELAWRKREGNPPVALKEEWRNLYASGDATRVQAASIDGTPRWRTFGQGLPTGGKKLPPAPLLGWSIASPMFCLSQGRRTVTLSLSFRPDTYDSAQIDKLLTDPANYPFQIEAGCEKQWLAPTTVKIESGDHVAAAPAPPGTVLKILRFTLSFAESVPPIAAMPGTQSRWPIIRLLLRPIRYTNADAYVTPYPLFRRLVLERVLIQVSVAGLKDLRLENDEGSLTAGKPFEPFGFSPSAGSGFQFVHPELVVKRLDRLDVRVQWMKLPATSLADHYRTYRAGIADNASFTARLSLIDHQLEIPLLNDAPLFDANDAGKAHTIGLPDIPARIAATLGDYAYAPELLPFSMGNLAAWPRYWRWELNPPDFQHSSHAAVAAARSIELATAITAKYTEVAATRDSGVDPPKPLPTPAAADYQVNPPYTPKLKSFSVDYECATEIVMNPPDDAPPEILAKRYGGSEERIHYQQAFGTCEIRAEPDGGQDRFLPAYEHQGELYIGLAGVNATMEQAQDVAILFQMAEGSANPEFEPPAVEWSILSGNRWLGLADGGILADSTHGLRESGIVKFRVSATEPSTLLPAKLCWLRAAVRQNCDSICDTVAIHTQAVSATWVLRDEATDHLNQPLPPGTITRTANPLPAIRGLSQPYTSYGGKAGERAEFFNARVSERLRHRQRAVTLWDFEHLILERFPAIYKAKCIPASSMEPDDLGKMEIIVIPDIRHHLPFNPFEPKATASQLAEIRHFVAARMSPSAEISVKNARYVPVRVRFAVRFMPDCDPGYYRRRLNDELNRFLSPWAWATSSDVVIGGKIYANALVNFIEQRQYVDYVAGLKLFKNEDGLGFKLVTNAGDVLGYRVEADSPDSVLVAERQHEIDLIADASFQDARFTGIGYMKIELDFTVD